VGELLANTLAVRGVTVVVLDIKPIQTENCEPRLVNSASSADYHSLLDNIVYHKCDVSKWEEVEAIQKEIVEDVRRLAPHFRCIVCL
jgi:NAD(P)-dependent dehydrogenase (short-subunit alcohol dehydrogenase family)